MKESAIVRGTLLMNLTDRKQNKRKIQNNFRRLRFSHLKKQIDDTGRIRISGGHRPI